VRARFWWRWLAATAVVYGVIWLMLTGLDTRPRPGPLLLLVALVMAVLAVVNINMMSDGPSWEVHPSQPLTEPGQDARLGMYVRVIGGHLDAKTVDPSLRDRLADLASAQLRQRHGLALRDPAATDLLGREVVDLLTGPPRRLARGEVEAAVRSIERL
jgi:hypothetical protein